MKSVIQPDHIPVNKFSLSVLGMPELTVVSCSGLTREVEKVNLPDLTTVSGGRVKPTDFTIKLPAHHTIEVTAMELWFQMGQDPVLPGYRRVGTLAMVSLSGILVRPFTLLQMFVTKVGTPELEANDEGTMAVIEYGLNAEVIPL